ncbi:MAG: PqiC family protein [Pseudomonadales bacterium]
MKRLPTTRANLLRLLMLSCVLIACSGCLSGGSSPEVRFYTLNSIDPPAAAQTLRSVVGVGPILFPDYLKRPQIVTRAGVNQMNIAEYDRWAEPLDAMFQRILVANLDSLTPDLNVITYPFGSRLTNTDYRVVGRVNRFEVDAAAVVTLEVQWVFSTTAEGSDDVTVTSRHTSRADAAEGYAGTVTAMSEALESFSRELATYLTTVTRQ